MTEGPTDWKATASLKRAELDELIHRLNEYREKGQATCIISASSQEEAVRIGLERFSKYMDIPRSCIRAVKARRLPT